MAGRILGMGDVLSLIEKAQEAVDEEKAMELERKFRENQFNFNDYLDQLRQMKKMGPLDQILGMIPGMGNMKLPKDAKLDGDELKKVEAIICSMSEEERQDPHILNGSRRRRIAMGSGTSVQDVNRLVNQFEDMKKMIRSLAGMEEGGKKKKKFMQMPFFK
jgi:signal recognition particle subunit SRP54